MATTNLGKVSVTPKGEYDPLITYERLDIISHNGSSYIVKQASAGVTPIEGEFYALIAEKGDGGSFVKKAYKTYAAMDADKVNIPANSSVDVTNDLDESKNGAYIYDGSAFTRSQYDSKVVTDKIIADTAIAVQDAINNTAVEGGVLADTFVTVTANDGQPATNLRELVSGIRKDLQGTSGNAINVERFGITGDNSDITAQLMQIIADNPTYTKYYFPDGAYSFSGFLLEKDGIELIGQSKSGTVFNVTQGSNGISFRCGKRGADSDARADNLPVFNGVNPVFTLADYSPATPERPRYKDIRVDNVTLNFIGNHATGFDFYRIDGGGYDVNITFSGTPTMGNVIRTFFCTNLWIPELETADNVNALYNVFIYWSYGIKGRTWKVGRGSDTGLEFKHGVNVRIDDVILAGATFPLNIGYGSRDISIGSLDSKGGTVRIKSSEEFDLSSNISISKLNIENLTGVGLLAINLENLNIDEYYIKAKIPINIDYSDFYMFSNVTGNTPVQSTNPLSYTGNYDTTKASEGFTKYYETRNAPALSNSRFGKGVLHSVGGVHLFIAGAGGLTNLFGSNGKVIRNKVLSGRGFDEDKRTSYRYDNDLPRVTKNVDFGEMELVTDTPDVAISPLFFSNPIQNCKGRFLVRNAPFTVAQIYLMFDSSIEVICDKPNTGNTYPFTIYTMVNSKISGSMKPTGRAFLLKSTATLYQDGFLNHAIKMDYAFPDAPTSAPVIQTEGVELTWLSNIDLSGSRIFRQDGTPMGTGANRIILHITTYPSNIDKADGGMYSQNALIDFKEPLRRTFVAATGVAPTMKPNYVGELAKNTTLDEWYQANSLTGWVAL